MTEDVKQISVAGLIATAFAFVAALAWNDAIQKTITATVGEQGSGVAPALLYAGIVTLIAILAIFLVAKAQKATAKLQKRKNWKEALFGDESKESGGDDKERSATTKTVESGAKK